MTDERDSGTCTDAGSVARLHGSKEFAEHSVVAAEVVAYGLFDLYHMFFTIPKICPNNLVTVSLEASGGPENLGFSGRSFGEGGSGHRGGGAILEDQIHHLMIAHIVVTVVDAPTVRTDEEEGDGGSQESLQARIHQPS